MWWTKMATAIAGNLRRYLFLVAAVLLTCSFCTADINIHNPRGSNNRLDEDERNRERKNNNRLFDSQNNDRGGHNVGEEQMYYYSGTTLQIQWANQHSCGDQNNNCEVILQYMCDDLLRDGTTTMTPASAAKSCRNQDCDTDERFGRHESYRYFKECALRERNKGLFTADQKVRKSARSTRQNPTGTRSGYECAEERDYYPYWGATPWKDIAVFTNNPERCEYYRQESQNVKEKYGCVFEEEFWEKQELGGKNRRQVVLFGDRRSCEESSVTIDGRTYNGTWVAHRAHNIPPPDCLPSQFSRDNHQGNTVGGEFLKYDWRLPDVNDQNCVLRIRYNVSTNDFDSWAVNSSHNTQFQPDIIWNRFNLTEKEAQLRHYYFRNNPQVDVFGTYKRRKKFRLRLAIDTAKYGRTFQDRTHSFRIIGRPKSLRHAAIHNVNVRGKRGNIVQVYPSVEYDFVPNKLRINQGDYVHFQWTGSDSNPANNDGQGDQGTDRSNIVQLEPRRFPKGFLDIRNSPKTNYPLPVSYFLDWDWNQRESLAHLDRCTGSDPLLNDKSAYFDMQPVQVHTLGTFYYMSTRNNHFSNRDQKASISVGDISYSPSDKGESYRGFMSVTTSGIPCQRWDSQTPHVHRLRSTQINRFGLEENFCRNPYRRLRPWCFTTDPNIKWEYCDIPRYPDDRMERSAAKNDMEPEEVLPDTDEDVPLQDEL